MGNATRRTEVIELSDQSCLTVSQFGLAELESLEAYIQGRVVRMGEEAYSDVTDLAEKSSKMQPIISAASKLRIDSEDGFSYLENLPGMVRMVYYALRPQHPEITLERCRQLMTGPNAGQIFKKISQANRWGEDQHLGNGEARTVSPSTVRA